MHGTRHARATVLGVPALVLLAITLAGGPGIAATPAVVIDSEGWGWVVARQPSIDEYTPAARDQGNSSGGTNTVRRDGKGNYSVTLGGLATPGGMVHVSPLGTRPRICTVIEWFADASDELVRLSCFTRTGVPADTAFVLNFLALYGGQDDAGYLRADQPASVDYTPDPAYQYNSADVTNSIHKLGTGRWVATFQNLGGATGGGHVQVTAYGLFGGPAACRVRRFVVGGPGQEVTVVCRDTEGSLVDTRFDLTYLKHHGLKVEGDPNVAYLLADRPTTGSYTPAGAVRYSSAGIAPEVRRRDVGDYIVRLGGMPLGGSAQVSPYGTGSRRCVVGSIRKTDLPQRIGVRCFGLDGDPADARFTLTYAK